MGNPLRDRRAPQELAASGQVIEIDNKISDFKGLADIIATDLGALDPDKIPSNWRDAIVSGRLEFGFADAQDKVPAVTGQVVATIDAVCQRCLQPFALPLKAELRLILGDGSADGYEGHEVWELGENECCCADLIEEALIMTIPFVVRHDDERNCVHVNVAHEKTEKKTLPFANLKAQMHTEN